MRKLVSLCIQGLNLFGKVGTGRAMEGRKKRKKRKRRRRRGGKAGGTGPVLDRIRIGLGFHTIEEIVVCRISEEINIQRGPEESKISKKPDDNQLQMSLLPIFRTIYWCRPGSGIAYRSQP
jgi:hypothetical protein